MLRLAILSTIAGLTIIVLILILMPQISHLYTLDEMHKVTLKLQRIEIVNSSNNQQNTGVKPVFVVTNSASMEFALLAINYSLFANDVYVGNSTISYEGGLGDTTCGCTLFPSTTKQVIFPTIDLKDSVTDGEKLGISTNNNSDVSWLVKGSYRLDTKDFSGIVSFTDRLDNRN